MNACYTSATVTQYYNDTDCAPPRVKMIWSQTSSLPSIIRFISAAISILFLLSPRWLPFFFYTRVNLSTAVWHTRAENQQHSIPLITGYLIDLCRGDMPVFFPPSAWGQISGSTSEPQLWGKRSFNVLFKEMEAQQKHLGVLEKREPLNSPCCRRCPHL